MKVSELLAHLTKRPHQDATLLFMENDGSDHVLTIESVAGGNEKSVLLMGKSTRVGLHPLAEALTREAGKIHNHKIFNSGMYPGKLQVSVDGLTLLVPFDTEKSAQDFLMGYSLGFAAGKGSTSTTKVDQ